MAEGGVPERLPVDEIHQENRYVSVFIRGTMADGTEARRGMGVDADERERKA